MKNKNFTKYFKERVLKYFKISIRFLNISKWNISSCISSRSTSSHRCHFQYCDHTWELSSSRLPYTDFNQWTVSVQKHVILHNRIDLFYALTYLFYFTFKFDRCVRTNPHWRHWTSAETQRGIWLLSNWSTMPSVCQPYAAGHRQLKACSPPSLGTGGPIISGACPTNNLRENTSLVFPG